MKILIFFFGITGCLAFNFVRQSILKNIDNDVDPCDDFFRHACHRDIDEDLKQVFNKTIEPYRALATSFLASLSPYIGNLESLKDIQNSFPNLDKDGDIGIPFAEEYLRICENDGQRGTNKTVYLEQLEAYICNGNCETSIDTLTRLVLDPNCTRAADHLNEVLNTNYVSLNSIWSYSDSRNMTLMISNLETIVEEINRAALVIISPLQAGLSNTVAMLEGMKKIAKDWIKKTPWLINENIVPAYIQLLNTLKITSDYPKLLSEKLQIVNTLEKEYRKCKHEKLQTNIPEGIVLCFDYAAGISKLPPKDYEIEVTDEHNAEIKSPNIYIGHYDAAIAVADIFATQIGHTANTVGHEMAHAIIESYELDMLLPYFSNETRDCIMDVFNRTCTEYEEESCYVFPKQIDENGADLLGLQLSYKFAEETLGENFDDIDKFTNLAFKQLYFYSHANYFCEKYPVYHETDDFVETHGASNVRVNIVSQLPGFKEAFNCPDDSRMIRTASDQCIIFGEGASETR